MLAGCPVEGALGGIKERRACSKGGRKGKRNRGVRENTSKITRPTKHSKQNTLEQETQEHKPHEHVDMEHVKATQENFAELQDHRTHTKHTPFVNKASSTHRNDQHKNRAKPETQCPICRSQHHPEQ